MKKGRFRRTGAAFLHNCRWTTEGLLFAATVLRVAFGCGLGCPAPAAEGAKSGIHRRVDGIQPDVGDWVAKSIEVEASVDCVWRAITESDRIAMWMGGARVESTWAPGAEIAFSGKLHRYAYRDRGTVLAAEPEKLLRYSHWSALSRRADLPENRTVITLMIEATGGASRLTVRHEGLQGEDEYGHANYFWGFALQDLKKLLDDRSLD